MNMILRSICLVSKQVEILKEFYQRILKCDILGDDDYIEIMFYDFKMSVVSRNLMEQMSPGSTNNMVNGNCIIEILVDDVDKEYEHLIKENVEIVKIPTTQTWGVRSVWFKDPDGNIINFFKKVNESIDLKEIAKMYFTKLINEKNISICDTILSNDYQDNDATPDTLPGPDETKRFVSAFLFQYPDMILTIEDIISEGNKVVLRNVWKGTNKDTLEDFHRMGIIILEFNENNQIKKRWSSYYNLEN